jgi:hypothetical protein
MVNFGTTCLMGLTGGAMPESPTLAYHLRRLLQSTMTRFIASIKAIGGTVSFGAMYMTGLTGRATPEQSALACRQGRPPQYTTRRSICFFKAIGRVVSFGTYLIGVIRHSYDHACVVESNLKRTSSRSVVMLLYSLTCSRAFYVPCCAVTFAAIVAF